MVSKIKCLIWKMGLSILFFIVYVDSFSVNCIDLSPFGQFNYKFTLLDELNFNMCKVYINESLF